MVMLNKLAGMSKRSKAYVSAIRDFIREGEPRESAYKHVTRSYFDIPLHTFRTEWGIISNYLKKQEGATKAGSLKGRYQRMSHRMWRRYKTIVELTVLNEETGEIYDMYVTVTHNKILKSETLRRYAVRVVKEHTTTKIRMLNHKIVGMFESAPYPGFFD